MKFKKIIMLLSFLFILMLCISSVSATNDDNGDYNLTAVSSTSIESNGGENSDEIELSVSNDNSVLSAPKTIYVSEVGENHNEMNEPTIQKAIDGANDGDTVIIEGKSYVHCHFIVNKKLTIKSNVGTVMTPCGSIATSNYQGIFYLSSKASGSVIEGFNINVGDNVFNDDAYGIYAKGASDITIKNCNISTSDIADDIRLLNTNNVVIEDVTLYGANNAIKIVNSQNVNVRESVIKKSNVGINIIDSTKTTIISNNINNNLNSGISSSKGSYLTVIYNNITDNGNGIETTYPEYVYILSNYIAFNNENGVYVDYTITQIEIKGNFFNQNKKWEVCNDFHVQNLRAKGHKIEIIDNNYMINYAGYGSGDVDRPVWTQIYEHKAGDYDYDAENDVYVYVGSGGEYYGHQDVMFLKHVFEINEYMHCPNTYSAPQKVWANTEPSLELQLSNITQVKKGIYSISLVDSEGNIATDLSSVPVTFYLNKISKSSTPQEDDVYKTVMMKNGTATVRFYSEEFNATGNVITAVFPTPGTQIDDKVSKTLAIVDENIPGIPTNTTVKVYNLNTYPNSNQELIATLTDINGNAMVGQTLTVTINSKNHNVTTDENGKAKLKISLSKEGTYDVGVVYNGDELDYYGSSAQAKVVVKKTNTKIVSSNLNMIPKMAEYYAITLKDASGKAISNQKITFKVNGQTYNRYTDSKGVAKVQLKFSKNKKTYKISITYNGNNKYNGASKTNNIFVKYSSKTARLSIPTVTIPPKTVKYYTVTLKDANGKAISKQKVIVKVNGKKYTKKTNSKGQVKIKVKFSKLKTYKVSATYGGNKIYKKASSSGKIKVAKTTTKITAPTVSTLPKVSKTYTVTLKANNKALAKQKLTIKINGKNYSKTTNSKGQASVSVKLTTEKSYVVNVNYRGTDIYKASKATGKISVSKIVTQIESYDKTYSKDGQKDYQITLKDKSGNLLKSQKITFTLNGQSYAKTTDLKGRASIDLTHQNEGSFNIVMKYSGNDKYKAVTKTNKITISNKTNIVFVDSDLPNFEIQNILDSAADGANVKFLGDSYVNIALNIKKPLNISTSDRTILNAKANNPVFRISSNNVNISGFSIQGGSGDAIVIYNACNVTIFDNFISNNLTESKIPSYVDGTVNLPGYGVSVLNSSNVVLSSNYIDLFETAIFAEYSSKIVITNNTLRENNYGVKYGFGVLNTRILYNEITENIGLYIMTVPEGPTGYGILLNNSAVNVTITHNHIWANHIGISLDANYSTGIVITQNTITDNVLEGIRFNAGYDLAQNAVGPVVTDNAIYRNARGPSMMILGEMSANPFGIYGGGLYNDSEKLQIGPNWYGANQVITWDNDTGKTGYGTMCPRIKTTEILFNNITYDDGNYSLVFYKNGEIASNLPEFDLYATLNRGTEKQADVVFDVVNGIGTFGFNASNYKDADNIIEISVGSLIYSTSRVFKVTYAYEVPQSEIKI